MINAIRALPEVVCDDSFLANPSTLTHLVLAIPAEHTGRFVLMGDVARSFEYFGRESYAQLIQIINQALLSRSWPTPILVYGTPGNGKSHLLAALACALIRRRLDGKMSHRVIFIHDCALLEDNFVETVHSACRLAFFDDPQALSALQLCDTVADLQRFTSRHRGHCVLIADQKNAIDYAERPSSSRSWMDSTLKQFNDVFGPIFMRIYGQVVCSHRTFIMRSIELDTYVSAYFQSASNHCNVLQDSSSCFRILRPPHGLTDVSRHQTSRTYSD